MAHPPEKAAQPVSMARIERTIHVIRDQNVMLDFHLADLYGVETKALNQAVSRNLRRFPDDFMFRLSKEELTDWRSQIVTSNPAAKMGLRRPPRAFTEQGVAMLSSVLRSERAVQVNIAIMRAFMRLRQILANHEELRRKLGQLESKLESHDVHIVAIFDALRELTNPATSQTREIGFQTKGQSTEK